jgi:hypothetical protein
MECASPALSLAERDKPGVRRFWIITDADHSVITVLMPEDD